MRAWMRGLVVAVLVGLRAAGPAHAEVWSAPDDPADVAGWFFTPEPAPCGTSTPVDATLDTNDDLVGLRVRHGERAIRLTARLRDLSPELEQDVTFHLASARGAWFVDVGRWERSDGTFRTATVLGKQPAPPDPDDLDECGGWWTGSAGIACRTPAAVDTRRDRVVVTVPRLCLRDPRWVRVGARTDGRVEPGSPMDTDYVGYSDEWGVRADDASPWLPVLGPRVRRP